MNIENLEQKLEYTFNNKNLLLNAVTHSSFANESKQLGVLYNERLEFLGDSILGFVVAEYLFSAKDHISEGRMTRLRAELVCEKNLVIVANDISLGEHLRLGRGEQTGGGRTRPSILADAVEAVIAAMYLDGGIECVKSFIYREIITRFEITGEKDVDYKSRLQELVQKKNGQVLKYELYGEHGPDHAKVFEVNVVLNGEIIGHGIGKSKKSAEQDAARDALEKLS